MTRSDDFIQQLESYLDEYEGLTPLPGGVRDAVRAEVPMIKQAGPLRGPARYTSMILSSKAIGIGLAAAAAILALAVGTFFFNGQNVGGPADSPPAPATESTPSASAAAGDVCEATTVRATGLGARTLEVVWCAYGPGEPRQVNFTMEAPSSWAEAYFPGAGTLWLRPAEGGAITLAIREDESVEEVVSDIAGREGYLVENQTSVTLDGAAGVSLDVSLAEGVAPSDAPPLIADDDQTWQVQAESMTRLWVVDLAGDTLMIAAGEPLTDAVGEALATIEWAE